MHSIIKLPGAFKVFRSTWASSTGGTSDRLVGSVDLASTTLSLVGLEAKDWMQG